MTSYRYKAISESGVKVSGVVDAYDEYDAVSKIKETCPVVVSVDEVPDKAIGKGFGQRKVNVKSLSLVCEQFAIILKAGMPLVHTVELVAGQTADPYLKKLLLQVAGDVGAGSSLATSFEKRGPKLPVTFIETIRAGEESGSMDIVFDKLATYYKKSAATKAKVTSVMIYPATVIVVGTIVVIVIMVVAMPRLMSTFSDMDMELPFLTVAMMAISNFMGKYILLICGLIAALVLGAMAYGKTEPGRLRFAKILLGMPVLGAVAEMNSASQFASTMSTMIGAGLPVPRALSITGKTMSNYVMGCAVQRCVVAVESGRRIGEAMKSESSLPDLLREMTAVGEESGALEDTLQVIGQYYDNEVTNTTAKALALMEPAIICVLAVFVVLLLLAVYAPIFSMYGAA